MRLILLSRQRCLERPRRGEGTGVRSRPLLGAALRLGLLLPIAEVLLHVVVVLGIVVVVLVVIIVVEVVVLVVLLVLVEFLVLIDLFRRLIVEIVIIVRAAAQLDWRDRRF